MHSANIILLLIVLLPALIVTWFRINAVFLFFSLCLGYVLANIVSGDGTSLVYLLRNSLKTSMITPPDNLKLVILFTPVLLTIMFMFRSIDKSKALLNLIPSLCFTILILFLASPLVGSHLLGSINQSSFYIQLIKAKDLVLELISLVVLFFLFVDRLNRHGSQTHHRFNR